MSLQARFADLALLALGWKRVNRSAERTRARINDVAAHPAPSAPPPKLSKRVGIERRRVGGIDVYRLTPPGPAPPSRVLYLHGGSYTFEITAFHWRFAAAVARSAPAVVDVPIYGLAPAVTAAATVPAMTDLAAVVIAEAGGEHVTLLGDSAGGGLALAIAQQLRERGGTQPARVVMVSPWLDIAVDDPRQREIDPHDHILGIDGMRECGRRYAGGLDPGDPRVSPLFGDLSGLPRLVAFCGTHDILLTDARALAERARAAGAEIEYHEAPGMQHVYPLFPLLPEAKAARAVIARHVRG